MAYFARDAANYKLQGSPIGLQSTNPEYLRQQRRNPPYNVYEQEQATAPASASQVQDPSEWHYGAAVGRHAKLLQPHRATANLALTAEQQRKQAYR